jgi:prepilin peptidase CpaA
MMQAMAAAAAGLFLWAAASDVAMRRIPNRLTALLALVGMARLVVEFAGGAGWQAQVLDLGTAAAVLAVGAAGFAAGLVGGGDVKLAAAASLWLGAAGLATFIIVTALAGGVLAFGYLALAAMPHRAGRAVPTLPYGVALAAGGLAATLHIP